MRQLVDVFTVQNSFPQHRNKFRLPYPPNLLRGYLLDLYGKLGWLHYAVSDYRRAGEVARRQLALAEESGDRRWYAVALNNIGLLYLAGGNLEQATAYLEKALALAERVEYGEVAEAARKGLALISTPA